MLQRHAATPSFNPIFVCTIALNMGSAFLYNRTTKHTMDSQCIYQRTWCSGAVYGVTWPDCPAQRDLYGDVVAAMRAQGVYRSILPKADWHVHHFGTHRWVSQQIEMSIMTSQQMQASGSNLWTLIKCSSTKFRRNIRRICTCSAQELCFAFCRPHNSQVNCTGNVIAVSLSQGWMLGGWAKALRLPFG